MTFKVSAIELIITDDLVVRDLDDKAVEHGFLSQKQTIQLTTGEHTLVIKYKDVFEDLDFAEERLITSDYFVVKFNLADQKKLILSTININDLAAAERFSKDPELTLLDEHQQSVVLTLEKLSDYELTKQVTKVVNDLSIPVVAQTKGETRTKDELTFNKQVIEKIDVVPMLKYWWDKASQDDKESFLLIINENMEIKK
ncbi:DUF2057 family protein [Colwellia psychrerythraea]|uniref:DUF2057 family protein n=1 Tax=Colwellia psychrerythraea TaxID=28229 RepID=UPI001E3F9809|nr:DUF2057 family protein [Colwellia psychrerythraea]